MVFTVVVAVVAIIIGIILIMIMMIIISSIIVIKYTLLFRKMWGSDNVFNILNSFSRAQMFNGNTAAKMGGGEEEGLGMGGTSCAWVGGRCKSHVVGPPQEAAC
jgi:hypothetical protein